MFTRNQIIACVVKQYGTGLYRSCISLDKGSTICLSTHDDEQSANETINQFWQFWQSWEAREGAIKRPEDVSLFLKSFTGRLGTASHSGGEMALAA